MRLVMDNFANPLADQWYRSLSVNQRMLVKTSFADVTGVDWSEVGAVFNMRERIALYHQKLVAEGVIRPCGYGT